MVVVGSDYSSDSTTVSIATSSQRLSAPFLCLDTFKKEFQLLQGHFQMSAYWKHFAHDNLILEFMFIIFVKINFYTSC